MLLRSRHMSTQVLKTLGLPVLLINYTLSLKIILQYEYHLDRDIMSERDRQNDIKCLTESKQII